METHDDDMPPSLRLFRREASKFPRLGHPMRPINTFPFSSRRIHVRVQHVDQARTLDVDGDAAHALAGEKVTLNEVQWVPVQRVGHHEGSGDWVGGEQGETGSNCAAAAGPSSQLITDAAFRKEL